MNQLQTCTSLPPVDYNSGWGDMALAVASHAVPVLSDWLSDVIRIGALGLCLQRGLLENRCWNVLAAEPIIWAKNAALSHLIPPPCPPQSCGQEDDIAKIENIVTEKMAHTQKLIDNLILAESKEQQLILSNPFKKIDALAGKLDIDKPICKLTIRDIYQNELDQTRHEGIRISIHLTPEQGKFHIAMPTALDLVNYKCFYNMQNLNIERPNSQSMADRVSEHLTSIAELPNRATLGILNLSLYSAIARGLGSAVSWTTRPIVRLLGVGAALEDYQAMIQAGWSVAYVGTMSCLNEAAQSIAGKTMGGMALFAAADGVAKVQASIERTNQKVVSNQQEVAPEILKLLALKEWDNILTAKLQETSD